MTGEQKSFVKDTEHGPRELMGQSGHAPVSASNSGDFKIGQTVL